MNEMRYKVHVLQLSAEYFLLDVGVAQDIALMHTGDLSQNRLRGLNKEKRD
jgi:hypothetical protein